MTLEVALAVFVIHEGLPPSVNYFRVGDKQTSR